MAARRTSCTRRSRLASTLSGVLALLLSMTGFGEAHCQQDGLAVAVEVRTINSRFFKLSVRTTEGYASLEPQIEAMVREPIRRGTIQVNVRVDRAAFARGLSRSTSTCSTATAGSWKSLYRAVGHAASRAARGPAARCRAWSTTTRGAAVDADGRLAGRSQRTLRGRDGEPGPDAGRRRPGDGGRSGGQLPRGRRRASTQIERRAPLVVEDYRDRLDERLQQDPGRIAR